MTTKIDPVSTIVDSFPIPELSIIGDLSNKPTYHSLLKAQNELNTNAAAVDTTQGTGIHGLLVLTMSVTEFHTMVGFDEADPPVQIRHPIPVNPGALPADPTAAQLRTHADRLYHHQTHHSTDKALKKILLAAVPDLYISAIKHPRTGYATTTTLMILNHLWATYGEIKPEDLDQNTITMTTTWHPTSPIENLFLQIDDGIAFALAGESPIDDGTAVRIIYKIVLDTGVFELPCRDWRAKPRNEKTLANFKTFFQAANNDRATTTSSAGYHSASAAITPNDTLVSLLEAHNKLQKSFVAEVSTPPPIPLMVEPPRMINNNLTNNNHTNNNTNGNNSNNENNSSSNNSNTIAVQAEPVVERSETVVVDAELANSQLLLHPQQQQQYKRGMLFWLLMVFILLTACLVSVIG